MVAMKESTPKPNQFGARSRGTLRYTVDQTKFKMAPMQRHQNLIISGLGQGG